ncbi:MAG: glutamine synthetase family protein [Elusimicrobia bacterium]|nr:glutamine synthetase family protein [Elusimicrobiota bacterium]
MNNASSLLAAIKKGKFHTVILAMPDMQGRWIGKRFTARHFAKSVAGHGTHACAYLLTVDMEMDPVPGFALTSWDKGYQDFALMPDFSTWRGLAWLPGTALVVADVLDSAHEHPIKVAPRQILKDQVARAAAKGWSLKMATELEFYLLRETYESAQKKNWTALEHYGSYIEDYHILQGTREEPVVGEIRNLMEASGVPIENSKGEWGPGQHEINLEYSDPVQMADLHTVYKHGAKEIAMQKGASLTFMAKYSDKLAGSSCHIHASLWDKAGRRSAFSSGGKPTKEFRWFLGGTMALAREFSLFFAPTVNSYKRYQAATFAPTRIAWARDNRTCGFRVVGEGDSLRIENRIPGADANPYLALAATIAAGLHGIEKKIDPPPELAGDAYKAKVSPVPKTLTEAIGLFEKSAAARQAFGDEVFAHYLHAAKAEQAASDRAVTDWERGRYFERI